MMTQTPLSAARSTRRGEKLPIRPGVPAARSSSFQPQASSLQNVYPELRSPQPYSRKPFAPFVNSREAESVPLAQPHPRNRFAALTQFLRATDRGARATEILIDGSAIRNPRKALKT